MSTCVGVPDSPLAPLHKIYACINKFAGTVKIVYGVDLQGSTGESTVLNSALTFVFLESKVGSESQYIRQVRYMYM